MSGYADSEKIQYALKTALYRTMQTAMSDSASVERSAPLRVFPTNIMKVNIIEAGKGDIDEDGKYVTGHATAGQTADLSDPESTVKNYKIICPVNNVITDKTISWLVSYGSSTKSYIDGRGTSGTSYPLKQWFFRGHYSGTGEAAFNAANVTYDGLQLAWNSATNGATPTEADIVPHLKYYLQVQTNYTGVSHSSSADNITYEHGLLKGLIGLDSNFVSTIMVTQGEGGPSSSASLGTSGSQAGDFWFTQPTAGVLSFYGVTNKVDASTDLATFNTKYPMISYVRYTGETGFGAGTGGGGSVSLASADSNVSNMIGGTAQTMTTTSFEFDGNVNITGDLSFTSSNIGLGPNALISVTTGNYNVALGSQAMMNCTTGSNNIAIGSGAGRNKTTRASYIAIGQEALYSNDGGSQCIAIGYQALKSSDGNNHYDNVAIGWYSMKAVTSGAGNCCLGYSAGQSISSGWQNICIGIHAGDSITTAYRNICIGPYAGDSLTTSHDSVYIGNQAGQYCDQQNIAIGYQSMRYRCSSYNIAIGYQALVGTEHTGRAQNVCIGYQTLNPATSASWNVAIGHQAAMRVTSGNYNTLVGYQSGQYVATGANNICLGKASGTYIYYGSSNICIGVSTANAYSGAVQNMSNCICIGTYAGPKTSDTNNTCKLYIATPSAQNGDTYRGEDGSFIYGYYNSTTLTNRYLRINGHLGINCNPSSSYGLKVDSGDVYISGNIANAQNIYKTGSIIHGNLRIDANQFYVTGGGDCYFNWSGNGNTYCGNTGKLLRLNGSKILLQANHDQAVGVCMDGSTDENPDRGLCILDNQNTGQAIGSYYIGYNTSYQEPGALKIFQHLPIMSNTYRTSDGGGNADPAINIITNFIGSGATSATHQGGCIQWTNQSRDNPTSGGGHGQPYAAIYGGRHSGYTNYEGEMIFYTSDTTNRASGRNLNPRMTIKGGNVGIGTTSPGAKLHVNGNTIMGDVGGYGGDYTDALLTLGGTHNTAYNLNGKVKLLITGANNDGSSPYDIMCEDENGYETFFLKSPPSSNGINGILYQKGRIGIGEPSPSLELDVHGLGRIGRYLSGSCHDADKRNSYYFGRWDDTNAPESGGYPGQAYVGMELKVDSYSNIGYGNCGNQASVRFWTWGCNYATSRMTMRITADGYVRGINAFQNNSDDRLKHNEKHINVGLNVINKLQAKEYFKTSTMFDENGNMYGSNHNFNLNTDGLPIDNSGILIKGVTREMGFIAQDVLKIDELKHAVHEGNLLKDASGNTYRPKYGLTYQDIFVMNVAATQELDRKVIALEKENEELKTKLLSVAILESELAAIKQHLGI